MLPVVLNLKDKKIVIFGAGKVSSRKILKLLNQGCKIKIISKEFSDEILKLKENLELVKAEIDEKIVEENVKDCFLAIIATNNYELNEMIERICKKYKVLVNRVDKISDVIFTADLRYNDIIISISTSGKFPGLSRYLKLSLKKYLDEILLKKFDVLIDVREYIVNKLKDENLKRKLLYKCIEEFFRGNYNFLQNVLSCKDYDDFKKLINN